MKTKNVAIAVGAALIILHGSAFAEGESVTSVTGGTLHFRGSLVDAACAVSTDSQDQVVDLGQHPVHLFKAAKDKSELRPFTIKLEDCDTTLAKTVSVAFTGSEDNTDNTLFAINADNDNGNNAKGVGIQILDDTSAPVKPNTISDGTTSSSAPVTLKNGENILNFSAQYVATAANPSAGTADADVTFVMQYQ